MKTDMTPVLLFIIKVVLGMSFIIASYSKIEDPAAFARIVYGYGVFPAFMINIIAIVIPFIELVAGLCLIMGLYARSSLLIINAMLTAFILLISFNLLRGHQFDCGCFSMVGQNHTLANIISLLRDILFLSAGIFMWKKTTSS